MEIYTWLAKVTWWFDGEKRTDYTLYYGNTFEDVAKQIDEDYGLIQRKMYKLKRR